MRANRTSGNIAKDRLEQMLLSDKIQLNQEIMVQMKREIRSVVRKYVNTEHMHLDIQIRLINEAEQGAKNVKTIQIKGL